MPLVHLHRHGDFSLLDGIGRDEEYAKRAAELGQSALALTDHGNLAGSLYHVEACREVGIKPIVGMEAYFRPDIQKDREEKNTYGYTHLVLLAKNMEGFKNLMRLTSTSYSEDNYYQKPNIDWRLLRDNSAGLIASSSCVSGILPQLLLKGDIEGAETTLRVFQDIFGEDFYLELQPHNFDEQRKVNIELINMSMRNGVPIVAANDAHYPFKGWNDTQDIALMISTATSVKKREEQREAGKNVMEFTGDTFWLMDEDELVETFYTYHPEIPESTVKEMIDNSQYFADQCEEFNYDKSPKIPRASKDEGEAEHTLRRWCNDGLARINKASDSVYVERMEHELSVIGRLGVSDYFIIVGDMVRWAKSQGIRVGPGRGSAAGSLVNYLIGITAVDPIGYGLLFERFLNEYRTELPDIDIDFQDDRRDEVKAYLKEKWGDEYVVDVAAFQSFGHKGVIQDVGRVLDLPYMELKRVTDQIPPPTKLFGKDLNDVEEEVPSVKALFQKYPALEKHSKRLFGQMKGSSRHAGAVIITDQPARDLIPMMRSKDDGVVTQWSERANAQLISPYGFLKIDCLSVDDLSVQQKTVDMIRERHGINIDLDDPKQFPVLMSPYEVEEDIIESFSDGANIGVFQFESAGIVGLLKTIKPTNMEHVIAANALYRPGTLENQVAFEYARRKNDLVNWKLPHEIVREFIGETYGFMIYQEQVMQIFDVLAKDATSAEAAIFLKVVAKGVARDFEGKQKMQKYYNQFAEGCLEKGMDQKSIDILWSQILQMSTYSFNKSHSTGYGVNAYLDKWLKKRFPLEFYTNLMTKKTEKISQIIRESRHYGINILPPDINESGEEFTIAGNSIRFGLLGIKDVGPKAIDEIKKKRPFKSFEHMMEKIEIAKLNAKVRKALFEAGAFDSMGGRETWVLNTEATKRVAGTLPTTSKTRMEKERMGFTISGAGDILKYKDLIEDRITYEEDLKDGESALVAGEVINVKEVKTKKGATMAFVDLDYLNTTYSITVFPNNYTKYLHMLTDGSTLLAIGNYDEERHCVVADHICTAEQLYLELNEKR